jgi:hypothetical protein
MGAKALDFGGSFDRFLSGVEIANRNICSGPRQSK